MAETIKCIIENRIQTKKGTKFSFKNLDTGAEGLAITFGDFDASWLGERAEFSAEYNEKFKNYNIKGDITLLEGDVSVPPVAPAVAETEVAPPVAKKRGRPAKVVSGGSRVGKSEAEVVDAVALVRENVLSAQALAKDLKLNPTDDAVIALADMIGRCKVSLRIEAGKDRRMASFKK